MIGTQAGPFVIRRLLDESGRGEVYLAEAEGLGYRRVTVLWPELTRNRVTVQRFVNEAQAVAELGHGNIAPLQQVGRLRSGPWYLVEEHVAGWTLARLLQKQGGPMAPERILRIASEIASGLQAAHDCGIVHRELEPDHLYIEEGRVRIAGFGLARLPARSGTAAYRAPEQLRGREVGTAADVFALGALLYQLTAGGRMPYQEAETARAYLGLAEAEIYHRQISGRPIDPRRYASPASEAWVRALGAALEVDPARRPPSASALVRMLAEAVPGGLDLVRAHAGALLDHPTVRSAAPGGSRYRLGERLGVGGMAEVFEGTVVGAEGFARRVAIKRVLAERAESPRFAAMFVEEARIASRLSHPNVVSVLDFDRDPDGKLFLVMELVEGKSLAALCEAKRLPASIAIFVASEILRGLGYAHELPHGTGYVHRDLSPHNVLVSWEGAVKVSDFGIAKALEGGGRSGIVQGKPAYMSPEQVDGEELDGRSDLFVAGALLWELLAGKKLFTGKTREVFTKILLHEVPRPGARADLEAVVMKLLARDRDARYPTAAAAIEALARCHDHPRDGRGELVRWMARRFPAEARDRARPRSAGEPAVTRSDPAPRARRRAGAVVTALAVVLSAIGGSVPP